jgi:glycosyltransferase involved in cell wall biosynthesis
MNKDSQGLRSTTRNGDKTELLTLSVVIPALNEEDGIAGIVGRVLATDSDLKSIGIRNLEVVVVDDGSIDDTARIVEQMPGVRLVKHAVNRGYGAAIKTGFGRASGDLLAFLDADSTYPPECFVELCKVMMRENADVVIGSRRSGTESNMPAVRRLGNLIWSSLLSLIGNEKVQDPASGMRILRRHSLHNLYPLPDGLNFTPVMSTRALHEGLKVVEIPIPYRERSGRSKLSVVRDGTRFLKTILWTALQYNPARILELVGFGALAIAGLIGVLLIAARVQGITTLGPLGVFAVFTSLVMGVGGVSIFSLGISFNYLVALLHERPIRQANFIASLLGPSPERRFGWIGLSLGALGTALGLASLLLGIRGWEITRLWLWLLGSASFLLVGLQLTLFWMLIQVLETVRGREGQIVEDLAGPATATVVPGSPQPAMGAPGLN